MEKELHYFGKYTYINTTDLILELNFEDPISVSQYEPDELIIEFKSRFIFVSEDERMPLHEESLVLRHPIPMQYYSKLDAWIMGATKVVIGAMAGGSVIWFLILEIFASKMLKRLWPLLMTLQCIIVILLFDTHMPIQAKQLLVILQETIEMKTVKEAAKSYG